MCFQLIHFLPDVGSHLSWLETEYKAGILMTATLHPPPSSPPPLFLPLSHLHTLHLSSLHMRYILSAQLISCLLSLSPLLTLLISALSRCSCTLPTQISLPPLLSFTLLLSIFLSDLTLPLPLLSLSFTSYIIQLHSSSLLPFLPLPIPPLISPPASPLLLVFSSSTFYFLSFSFSLLSSLVGLPPITFLFLFLSDSFLLCVN